MCAGRPGVIREDPGDRALRGDLYTRAMLGERALDRGVLADGRAAGRGEERAEDDRAKSYERGTLSPRRCMRFSTSATTRMRRVRATISTIITGSSTSPRTSPRRFPRPCLSRPSGCVIAKELRHDLLREGRVAAVGNKRR
jgi:hypothetical protein